MSSIFGSFFSMQGSFVEETSAQALAAWTDWGVKGVLLLALAFAVATAMRRASAASRHLVWTLALAGLLLLPALSLIAPAWRIPILPPNFGSSEKTETLVAEPAAKFSDQLGKSVAPSALSAPRGEAKPMWEAASSPANGRPTSHSGIGVVNQTSFAGEDGPSHFGLVSPTSHASLFLLAVWAALALLMFVPTLLGLALVARLARRCTPLDDPRWRSLIESLKEAIGLPRAHHLCVLRAPDDTMPMAAGLLRPVIILPNCADEWSDDKRRAVLLHELAHVKRRDCLTHALARLATALHWPNPLAWFALRRIRIERERACDDLVLLAGQRPAAYADCLLQIAGAMSNVPLAAAAAVTMARKSQLEGRLLAVLDVKRKRGAVKKWAVALGILLLLALAIPLGLIKLSSAPGGATATSKLPSPTPVVIPSAYFVTFSCGARATVLGMGEPGENPNRPSWSPGGAPYTRVPLGYEITGGRSFPQKDQVERQLYLMVEQVPKEANVSCEQEYGGALGSTGYSKTKSYKINGASRAPVNQTETKVKVGIASGAWNTVIQLPPGSSTTQTINGKNVSAACIKPFLRKGKTYVVVSHDFTRSDQRVVAYDEDGRMFEPKSCNQTGWEMLEADFGSSIAPEAIKEVGYQTREYEWKEISGIRLSPSSQAAIAPPQTPAEFTERHTNKSDQGTTPTLVEGHNETVGAKNVFEMRWTAAGPDHKEAVEIPWHRDAERNNKGKPALWVERKTLINERDVAEASVVSLRDPSSSWWEVLFTYSYTYYVDIRLSDDATRRFAQTTESGKTRIIAVVLDGGIRWAPKVMSAITDGRIRMTCDNEEQAKDIVARLRQANPKIVVKP